MALDDEFLKSAITYVASARRDITAKTLTDALIQALGDKGEISLPSDMDEWIQKGREAGIQQGRHQGTLTRIFRQLRGRFGTLDRITVELLEKLTTDQLIELGARDFSGVPELGAWLPTQQRQRLEREAPVTWLKDKKGKHKLNAGFFHWVGYQGGSAEGLCLGLELIVLEDLQAHLGALDDKTVKQVQQLAAYQLDALHRHSINFSALTDLKAWLSDQ